jgi:hypothetical protein
MVSESIGRLKVTNGRHWKRHVKEKAEKKNNNMKINID